MGFGCVSAPQTSLLQPSSGTPWTQTCLPSEEEDPTVWEMRLKRMRLLFHQPMVEGSPEPSISIAPVSLVSRLLSFRMLNSTTLPEETSEAPEIAPG
jgi:hypothetical protein